MREYWEHRRTTSKGKNEFTQLPKITAQQVRFKKINHLARYNTEPYISQFESISEQRQAGKYNDRNADFSVVRQPKAYLLRNNDVVEVQKLGRNLSLNRNQNVSKIIETRKSIKILVDFFQAKSQESRNANSNCYHSPKKPPLSLVEIGEGIEDYHPNKRLLMGKIKKKGVHPKELVNESIQKLSVFKRYKKHNLIPAVKIRNAVMNIHHSLDKLEKSKKNGKSKVNPSMPEFCREQKVKLKGELAEPKMTQIGGWRVNVQQTQYLL